MCPIVRGKQNNEFAQSSSLRLCPSRPFALGCLSEGLDLTSQVENYHDRTGHYPERVLADPLYGTEKTGVTSNRKVSTLQVSRRSAEESHGRQPRRAGATESTAKNRHLQRIPIEGKFGQGKAGTDSTTLEQNVRIPR